MPIKVKVKEFAANFAICYMSSLQKNDQHLYMVYISYLLISHFKTVPCFIHTNIFMNHIYLFIDFLKFIQFIKGEKSEFTCFHNNFCVILSEKTNIFNLEVNLFRFQNL